MKWTRVCLLGLTACGLGAALVATAVGQDAAAPSGLPVRVCDLNEVYANYDRAADLNAELTRRQDEVRTEARRRAEAESKLAKELDQWKRGSEAFEKRYAKLEQMRAENNAWQQLAKQRLQRWHLQRTKEMYREIIDAVGEVARQRGLSLVLHVDRAPLQGSELGQVLDQMSRRTVLYGADEIDLTDTVLEQVNVTYQNRQR